MFIEYTTLGNTDIKVSKLCVRCMSFGKSGTMHAWTLDEAQSEKMVQHALMLGINFFETKVVERVATLAEKYQCKMSQIALDYLKVVTIK